MGVRGGVMRGAVYGAAADGGDVSFDLVAQLTPARIEEWRHFPYPGGGDTARRHRLLSDLGRIDLSLARIAEAHTDALAILHEAGRKPMSAGLYGVWASDGPKSRLTLERLSPNELRVHGLKQYCSGCGLLDAALVSVHAEDGLRLVEVPLNSPGLVIEPSVWKNPALRDTVTATVQFNHVRLGATQLLGEPGWYLERPGFWHGAMGPAACWAGGALSLIDAGLASKRDDAHARAQRGALAALAWSMQALLDRAGDEIDQDPLDGQHRARARALMLRHLVERQSTETLDRFGRLTGPALLAFDDHCARQYGALTLYLRQCHAEQDLEALGARG
jgi:alkylation response protein AidB-like acyl-CoA dehydrogenase